MPFNGESMSLFVSLISFFIMWLQERDKINKSITEKEKAEFLNWIRGKEQEDINKFFEKNESYVSQVLSLISSMNDAVLNELHEIKQMQKQSHDEISIKLEQLLKQGIDHPSLIRSANGFITLTEDFGSISELSNITETGGTGSYFTPSIWPLERKICFIDIPGDIDHNRLSIFFNVDGTIEWKVIDSKGITKSYLVEFKPVTGSGDFFIGVQWDMSKKEVTPLGATKPTHPPIVLDNKFTNLGSLLFTGRDMEGKYPGNFERIYTGKLSGLLKQFGLEKLN